MKKANPNLIDFVDPGMHGVFLVKDVAKFAKNLELEEDEVALSFGLKYNEWLSILIEAFEVDRNFDEENKKNLREKKIILTLNEELSGFSYFSRIKSFIHDVTFDCKEVSFLKAECNKLQNLTVSQNSFRGIEKMIMICDWATTTSKSIYFLGK